MAHFAEIDNTSTVLRVIVIDNINEANGQEFIANELGLGGDWVQTSYNDNIRKNFAVVGFTYDQTRDAFIPPQPFPSWLLDEVSCQWQPPVPPPSEVKADGGLYAWDESLGEWV